jgi:two-component system, cell cycle sensor histidine kinase and response regulator CckA
MPHPLHRPAPVLPGDEDRVDFLKSLNILDTQEEASFDRITEAASTILNTPIALVSLVDKDRQWFKSKVGLPVCETSRDLAFCSHAIIQPDERPFIVNDALEDERFKYSDLVLGEPHIRFYAGAPLVLTADDGSVHKVGTLCVIDKRPRQFEQEQILLMETLARLVVAEIELRDKLAGLHEKQISQVQEGAQVRTTLDSLVLMEI